MNGSLFKEATCAVNSLATCPDLRQLRCTKLMLSYLSDNGVFDDDNGADERILPAYLLATLPESFCERPVNATRNKGRVDETCVDEFGFGPIGAALRIFLNIIFLF